MTEISVLLRNAAETVDVIPGVDLAEADLRRGRLAASRLRTRRLAARGTAVVAAAGLLLAVSSGVGSHGGGSSANAATLVAYTGAQPAGYVVDAIPSGWHVAVSDRSFLMVGPTGPALMPVPGTNEVVDREIVVSWQGDGTPWAGAKNVRVGSVTGTYGLYGGFGDTHDPYAVMGLMYRDAAGHNIVIQIPPDLHWSASQAAAFAEGVHVTSAVANTGG